MPFCVSTIFTFQDRGKTPRSFLAVDISSMITGDLPAGLLLWGEMSLRGKTPRF
jgi:hypothetical protein